MVEVGVQLHPQAATMDALRAAAREAEELGDHVSGGRAVLDLGPARRLLDVRS